MDQALSPLTLVALLTNGDIVINKLSVGRLSVPDFCELTLNKQEELL